MSEQIRIQLTGWKAVVGGMLAIAIGAFFFLKSRTMTQEDLKPVVAWLEADYARQGLSEVRDAIDRGGYEAAAAPAEELAARAGQVRLTSISARGSSKEPVVRVEIEVNGATPPDGRAVRYFKMEYSALTGWRLVRETTAFAYHTALF